MAIILSNFDKALEEKKWKLTDFSREYDRRYPHYKNDSVCDSYSKFKKYRNGTTTPSLQTVMNMCDILGCDLDYITGRIPEHTHANKFIMEETGLSEESIEQIKTLLSQKDGIILLNILNLLLEDSEFTNTLPYDISTCYTKYKDYANAIRKSHAESFTKKSKGEVEIIKEQMKRRKAGISSISDKQLAAMEESYEVSRYKIYRRFDHIIDTLLEYIYEDES